MGEHTMSIGSRGLRQRLFVFYALAFIVPVLFMTSIVITLLQNTKETGVLSTGTIPGLVAGLAAAVAMSLMGIYLLYPSVRSVESAARQAESFVAEMGGEHFSFVTADDEAEKLSGYMTQMISELRQKLGDIDRHADRLEEANRGLLQSVFKDRMTGLYTQDYIKERLSEEMERSRRYGHETGVLMIDIDDFKKFNDTHGHLAGDEAIKAVTRAITGSIRSIDIPSRYGGEEFLVIIPETGLDGASKIAARIRKAVSSIQLGAKDAPGGRSVTVSIGAAAFPQDAVLAEELIHTADEHLYRSKRAGKNRVSTSIMSRRDALSLALAPSSFPSGD